ncbi:hypothetical protein ACFWIP_21900 [Streptomyces anulatus]|uniref:hypothetical protein n=1 Tax=Streptomyces anulatus TaxID=1892 RepID=UPI003660C2B8
MVAARITIPGHFIDYLDEYTAYADDAATDADVAYLVDAIATGGRRKRPAQGSYSVTTELSQGAADVLRERAETLMAFPPADGADEFNDDELADRAAANEILTKIADLHYRLAWTFAADEPVQPAEDVAPVAEEAPTSGPTSSNDGALSRWAQTMNGALAALQEKIEWNGGKWEFPALFDLEGRQVAAREVQGKFGWSWAILGAGDRTESWFTESKAKDPERKRATDAAKGYYVGAIRLNAHAELRGGGIGCVNPVAVRDDDSGFYPNAEVIDNGQPAPSTALSDPYGVALTALKAGGSLGPLTSRQTAVILAALAERAGAPLPAWESSVDDEDAAAEALSVLDELAAILRGD